MTGVQTWDLESSSGVSYPAYIGHAQVGNDYFKGCIDDVRVYNYALDPNEIRDLSYMSPADFDGDGIVNFFDYAALTGAWLTDDANYNLDGDGEVDYEDLDLFCDDWLWTPAWYQSMPAKFLAMGAGMDRGVTESTSLAKVAVPSVQIERISPVPAPYIDRKKVILDLLAELWLDPDVREAISEDDWLKFVEQVKSTLE